MNSIDFGRAFKAPFDDPDWVKKTMFGWLWGLLIVTSPAVMGALLDYIKSVASGNERLPEWDDFGEKWVRGFMVYVAAFIYFLPVWVLGLILLVPVIIAGSSDSNAAGALASGGFCLFWLFAIVYSIAVGIIFYAAIVNYALTGEFAVFFRFSDHIARIRSNTGFWPALGAAIVASFAAGTIAGIIPVIGWLISFALSYLAYMVAGHAFGQWAAGSFGLSGLAAAGVGFPPPPQGPTAYAPPAAPAPPAYQPPVPAAPAPPAYQPPVPQTPPAYPPPAAPAPEMPPAPMPHTPTPTVPEMPPAPQPPSASAAPPAEQPMNEPPAE